MIRFVAVLAIVATAILPAAAYSAGLPVQDVAEIRRVLDTYVSEWLAGHDTGVMRLLASDSVLIPGEKPPVVGSDAIRSYWWPAGGPTTTLQRYSTTRDQITGSGGVACVRGTQVIEWTSGGERWRTHGNYLTVLRKTSAGWRISIQMAGNAANERVR